ncbi:hypothetical protein BCR33DRAFT_714226 [Rhizoclosmatium globosum]|uniref:Glycosyltransferase family 17 protein n=1 Tax=Rhizoclosmatium globosum TaxID=329046 RepID=A0A1Y2CQ11_9FUNG|nr:hypothetical protein BCR33DRAFT_714226 [Rhizoclosmatium globosum]|eukprot:ORY48435.1 hypothetical protein BCR33DRAFT_714226 [Rhizoclosmatium globosum]
MIQFWVLVAVAANILIWASLFISTKESSPTTKRIPITQTTLNVAASDHYTSLGVSTTTSRSLLPTPTPTPVSSLCYLINGTDRLQTDPRPSLYDFTLYLGTDLESLNLRLRTLSPFIDTFYIVHPTETVTGKNISTIIPRSALATSKTVIQLEVNPSKYVTKDPKERKDLKYWTFEWKTFDGAYLEFKERVVASGEVPEGSLVLAGRVDEIPRIRALRAVKECNWEKGVYMYALEMERYIYGYQYRRLNPLKVYSTVLQWTEQARKLDGGYVRDGNGDEKVIKKAGWYCESCFVNVTTAQERFPNYGRNDLIERVEYGVYMDIDKYGPVGYTHDVPADIPPERRSPYAGFKDVREELRLKNYRQYTCADLKAKDKPKNDTSDPKVYDYILYNGEADVLEIRVNTMGSVVDKFLLAETNWTFSGLPKEFHFPSLKGKPELQIGPPPKETDNWGREGHHRFHGLQLGLREVGIKPGDILIHSDLDEMVRPTVLTTMKKCTDFAKPHITTLMPFYYFGYSYRHTMHVWPNGKVMPWTEKHSIDTFNVKDLRFDHNGGVQLEESGWHCSFCFSNLSQVITKVKSYSHQEFNKPEYMTPANIMRGFYHGFDLFGRAFDQFKYSERNEDLPDYVALNRERFEYMLHRRNAWSGFVDVKEEVRKNFTLLDEL